MRLLRRTRWIAVLLLALAPGAGGQLVGAWHPCPADAPAKAPAAAHQMAQGHTAAMHHAAEPAPSHAHHGAGECSCVGLCCAPAVAAAPTAQLALVVVVAPIDRPSWPLIDAADRLTPLPDRLPPKTAPPLA